MASADKPSDFTLTSLKISRGVTYFVYAYAMIATVFLLLAFFLQLFGASTVAPFTNFIYTGAARFMQPFRGIFPTHQVSDSSYFDSAMLFAIIMYSIFAAAVHALISYLSLKMFNHSQELEAETKD